MNPTHTSTLAPHLAHEKVERRRRERIGADRHARYRALMAWLLKAEEGPVRDVFLALHPPMV